MPFDHDSFSSVRTIDAASAAMRVIDALQSRHPPEVQAHGIAAAFILISERFGLEPQDVFTKTKNLMSYTEGRRPEFAAVSEYLEKEL